MKIYGTLGPACQDTEVLKAMFREGMTGMRLNLSHVSLARSEALIARLRRAAESCGVEMDLLMDMQGPELRIGELIKPMELVQGDVICLGEGGIPVPALIFPVLERGQQLLLNDGKISAELVQCSGAHAEAVVTRGGRLESRKSIALPGTSIRPPTLTPADLENIRSAARLGVTGLMQPFVRDAEDLAAVRSALSAAGADNVRILAKIENLEGVEKLDELIPACDEIIIARGDLGNALPLWELPAVQKRIAAACREAGRDFMVVTQMLASMETAPVPTRAEMSDVFNAVLDGASSLMLTGETAVGSFPAQAIGYMSRAAAAAAEYMK